MLTSGRFGTVLVLAAFVFAACSGGSQGNGDGLPAAPNASHKAPLGSKKSALARLSIQIPRWKRVRGRRPAFVSPSTQSMTVTIVPFGSITPVVSVTVNLTPSSPGCSSSNGTVTCAFTEQLTPELYTGTIATYDGTNATGHLLSAGQNLPFNVRPGIVNQIALTLNGIPHTIVVTAGTVGMQGPAGGNFILYGLQAQTLIVTAKDRDGNSIVGGGAPAIMGSFNYGTGWNISPSSLSATNTLTVTPPANSNGAGAGIHVQLGYNDLTCQLSGATCSFGSYNVSADQQTLVVANASNSTVTAYPPPYNVSPNTPILGTSGGDDISGPSALAMDRSANLYVANKVGNDGDSYSNNYTSGSQNVNFPGLTSPVAVTVNSTGSRVLYAGATSVIGFNTSSGSNTSTTTTGISTPIALAMDASNDLFVLNAGNNTVTEYTSPYNAAPLNTASSGISSPKAMVLSATGNLFVANAGNNTVTEYAPPYSSASAVITAGISGPSSLAIDANGNLYVANQTGNTVTEYASPYTAAAVATVTVSVPTSIKLDGAANLFVVSGNEINEYVQPLNAAPISIVQGIAGPTSLVFTP